MQLRAVAGVEHQGEVAPALSRVNARSASFSATRNALPPRIGASPLLGSGVREIKSEQKRRPGSYMMRGDQG